MEYGLKSAIVSIFISRAWRNWLLFWAYVSEVDLLYLLLHCVCLVEEVSLENGDAYNAKEEAKFEAYSIFQHFGLLLRKNRVLFDGGSVMLDQNAKLHELRDQTQRTQSR